MTKEEKKTQLKKQRSQTDPIDYRVAEAKRRFLLEALEFRRRAMSKRKRVSGPRATEPNRPTRSDGTKEVTKPPMHERKCRAGRLGTNDEKETQTRTAVRRRAGPTASISLL